jgi:hypothetical protein
VQLQAAAAVYQVDEGGLAVAAARSDSSCHAVPRLGLLAGLQFGVLRADVRDRDDPRKPVRKRLDALGAEPLELRATVVLGLRGQRSIFVILSLR